MSVESSTISACAWQELLKLQKQREIVERWLACPNIPSDALTQLMEMLTQIECELQKFEMKLVMEDGPEVFRQAG